MDEKTQEQLDRIEQKLDRVLVFCDFVTATVTPYLSGKGAKYLALFAKMNGGGR